MHRHGGDRSPGNVLGRDNRMAVGPLAEFAAVLMSHTDGAGAFFRKGRVIYGQDSAGGARGNHLPCALTVEHHWDPLGISEQVLKPLCGRAGNGRSDPLARLARKVGEQSRRVAFEALLRGWAAKKRHQRTKEGGQSRERDG